MPGATNRNKYEAQLNRLILALVFGVGIQTVYCQSVVRTDALPCSYLLHYKGPSFADYPFNEYHTFIEDYVDKNNTGANEYITFDPHRLMELDRIEATSRRLAFNSMVSKLGRIDIIVTIRRDTFLVNMQIVNNNDYVFFENVIEDSIGHPFLGHVAVNSLVEITRINSITVRTKKWCQIVDSEALKTLVNPNLSEQKPIDKPISVYYDSEKESIYIYVYGSLPYSADIENIEEAALYDGYASKIVVNSKDVVQINLSSNFLIAYGWLECVQFWPF